MKLIESIGKYIMFLGQLFTRLESFRTYIRLILLECGKIGLNSIFIVAIISLFMGAVMTLQTAYNLIAPYIPKSVIALVVRDAVLLELAPTVTAIVFAGKVGSNIAGELGTMRITEQIDALEVMGINATSYLVLPKLIAALIMYPLLVIMAMFLSLYGGFIVGSMAGVLTEQEYIMGIRDGFKEFNVFFGIIKSFAFAFLVSTIASFQGFYTQGGALEVGRSSTIAVTNSCIAILVTDYLLAQLLL